MKKEIWKDNVKHEIWIASFGTERPFITKTGHKVQYLFNTQTRKHAYYCFNGDFFIVDDELNLYGI